VLTSGHDDEVIALVATLVARNRELELVLAKLRESKNRGERVPREQLDLFLRNAPRPRRVCAPEGVAQVLRASERPAPNARARGPPLDAFPAPRSQTAAAFSQTRLRCRCPSRAGQPPWPSSCSSGLQ
jgi:hypothetical protein